MTDQVHGNDAERREPDLSVLGEDVAHPFDQTNGIVEGLEGDADDPENVPPPTNRADRNRDADSEDETEP